MQHDPRVDAYIAAQADFARPILERVRAAMALGCPDAVETIKWGRPFWTRGATLLGMMSGFKAHVAFGAWRPMGSTAPGRAEAGWDKVTSADALPDADVLAGQLRAAFAAVAAAPVEKPPRRPSAAVEAPADLIAAIDATGGTAHFAAFPPGARREYVDWITEAKRPETRAKRIAEAAAWIAQAKRRHWKYENC